jgi:hypothetical protein
MEIDLYDFRVEGVGFIPPSADVTLIFRCENPSQYEIELNANLDFYYSFHLSSLDAINMVLEGFDDWSYSGSFTATHRIFGIIPVVITRSL